MEQTGRMRQWVILGVALLMPVFTGCSGFFVPVTTTGGTTGGGGSTTAGDYVYVANLTTSSLAGFVVGSTGTLTANMSPALSLGYQPLSMVVTPNNTFLYVGGLSGIYLYPITSNGSVTTPSTGASQAVVYATSLAVSPNGEWLIALDGNTQQLDIFQINSSTGALTAVTAAATYSIPSGVWKPTSVVVSPSGTLIFAALGTGGDAVFTFNQTTGVAASAAYLATGNVDTGDYGFAVNPTTTYLYIARSGTNGGVAVFSIGAGGSLTAVSGSPFAAGNGTYSLAMDSTGTYLYAANRGDGTISGYTIVPATATAGPTLTPLSGSPYASGSTVQSLAIDNTGKYLLAAAAGGTPDLTMYSFDATTPGKLDVATSAATSTDPAGAFAVATTH
jgi:6-phosphogluconolactonase (cycloisomerase 2 family)